MKTLKALREYIYIYQVIQRSLPMQLVSVSEGDTFAFRVYAGTEDVIQSQGARTYVTVQVVD